MTLPSGDNVVMSHSHEGLNDERGLNEEETRGEEKEGDGEQSADMEKSTDPSAMEIEEKPNMDVVIPAKEPELELEQEKDEQEELFEDFPIFDCKRRKRKTDMTTQKSSKKQKILIKIHSKKVDQLQVATTLVDNTHYGTASFKSDIKPDNTYITDVSLFDQNTDLNLNQIDQMLQFYQQTHEEQLPEVIAFNHEKKRQLCAQQVKKLKEEDEAMRKEIRTIIQLQLKEKQSHLDRNTERIRNKYNMEEKADLEKLEQMYKEQCASNQLKIHNHIKALTKRHDQEIQKQANNHRQMAQSQGMMEQMANAVWSRERQRLQVDHRRQLDAVRGERQSVEKKCETDYVRERQKRRKTYMKRQQEVEQNRQRVLARLNQGVQQTHQRFVKRHILRLRKKRAQIFSTMIGNTEPQVNSSKPVLATDEEDRIELRPPSPIRSYVAPGVQLPQPIAAAARQKHRKVILSTIPKQLSIEVHNEGLWLSTIKLEKHANSTIKGKDDKSQKKDDTPSHTQFIPWGLESRQLLHTVVCGEMPISLDKPFHFVETLAAHGGHVRAVITDLRTGDETASRQRAESLKEQEEETLKELEKKAEVLQQYIKEAEKALSKAEATEKEVATDLEDKQKGHEKAKQLLQGFKMKFGRFFGPDGQVLPNTASEKDTRKLIDASHQYSINKVTREKRVKAATQALSDAQVQTQNCQNQIKQTQKAATAATTLLRKRKALTQDSKRIGRPTKQSETIDTERASVRVHDVISAFKKTAEKRRTQHAEKRTSNGSNIWVQGLPTLPGALKKILWHKMHRRRRQQVVLRPNQGRLVEELKDKIREHFKSVKGKEKSQAEKKIQRAEQLFLLATNPAAPEGKSLPAVPSTTTNDPWAEPGWYLNLSVPKVQRSTRSILPKNAEFTVFQQNFCEIATAPGRQAASFLSTTHLRPLTSPLSCVAQAISLAETTPMSSRNEVELTDSDPLNITDAMMKVGYTFYVRAPTKSTSQTKRKSSTKEELEVTVKKDGSSEDSSSKSRSSSSKGAGSNSTTSISTGNANTPPPQARRTSSKGEKSRRRATKSDPSPKGKAAIPKSTVQSQSQSQHSQVQPPKPQSQPQPQSQTYMQQQQGGSMSMRGVYGQGQAGQLEAQYGQQYMKPAVSATQASPARLQQLQVQPQQIQQALPPQQQLLPQRQQFPSSQQFQQQLRMMHQQAGARQGYPQGHPGHQMQFFNPAMAQRQSSFTSQQPLTIPVARGVAPPVLGVAPRQPQLRSSQQNGDDQNDPLFMLS